MINQVFALLLGLLSLQDLKEKQVTAFLAYLTFGVAVVSWFFVPYKVSLPLTIFVFIMGKGLEQHELWSVADTLLACAVVLLIGPWFLSFVFLFLSLLIVWNFAYFFFSSSRSVPVLPVLFFSYLLSSYSW